MCPSGEPNREGHWVVGRIADCGDFGLMWFKVNEENQLILLPIVIGIVRLAMDFDWRLPRYNEVRIEREIGRDVLQFFKRYHNWDAFPLDWQGVSDGDCDLRDFLISTGGRTTG